MSALGQLHAVALTAFAMGLSAIVGFERELARKPAGLRTHMLIGGAAALVVILGRVALAQTGDHIGDPSRALYAVVSGIGFLGGGMIVRTEAHASGLTSAASVFVVAALGAAVGLEQLLLGTGATLLVLVALRGTWALERVTGWRMRNVDDDERHTD